MNNIFEIPFCLLVAMACYAYRRALSGWKNAAFYAKGKGLINGKIYKYIRNLHYLETPAWYAQAGQFFPLVYLIGRLQGLGVWMSLGIALVLTWASSAIASPFYQCPINLSEGSPCINKDENPESEFAWGFIRFWWPRPWKGYFRVVSAIGGFVAAISMIILIVLRTLEYHGQI